MRKLIEYQDLGLRHRKGSKKGYIRLLMKTYGVNKINSIYSSVVVKGGTNGLFASKLLDELNIGVKREIEQNFETILSRKEGHIIAANLPHGGIDAIIILDTCRKYKKNTKIVVPKLIAQVPAIADDIIVYDHCKSNHKSSLRAMQQHLKEGGNLIIFAQKGISRGLKDDVTLEWKTPMLKLIKRLEAPLIPIFIKGGNSLRFSLLRAISERLADADSLNQIIKKEGSAFKLLECQRIDAEIIKSISNDAEIGLLLDSVFALSLEREKELIDINSNETKEKKKGEEATDFKALYNKLSSQKPYKEDNQRKYYLIKNEKNSFLIVIDSEKKEVIGQCTIKFGGEIVNKKKDNEFSFFTHFEYSHKLNKLLESSIELASIELNKERDNEISNTNYLCEALFELLTNSPNYDYIIGATTIIDSKSKLARRLMTHQIKKYAYLEGYKKSVTARLRLHLKPLPFMGGKYRAITERRDILSLFIRYTDEKGGSLSPTLRKLLQLGGKFIALGKIQKGENTTINGLILIKKQ